MSRRRFFDLLVLAALMAVIVGLLWHVSRPWSFIKHFDDIIEPAPGVVNAPWADKSSDKIPVLHGQAVDAVQKQLGAPNQEYEFSMGGRLDEFRCELMNTYPPGNPLTLGVRILEWQWRFPGFSVAVWFHRVDGAWVVLDTCRWKDGIVF